MHDSEGRIKIFLHGPFLLACNSLKSDFFSIDVESDTNNYMLK